MTRLKSLLSIIIFLGSTFNLISQNTGKNAILFASKPFSSNPVTQTEFKSGEPIYGRLILSKSLKSYCQKIHAYEIEKFNINGIFSDYIEFRADPIDQDPKQRTWSAITLYLKPADLEKNQIDFDIMPTEADASSFFGTAFFNELANSSSIYNYFGGKIEITIKLMKKGENNAEDEIIASAKITMNYTDANYENLAEWKDLCSNLQEAINSKYIKK